MPGSNVNSGQSAAFTSNLEIHLQWRRTVEIDTLLTKGCLPAPVQQDGQEAAGDQDGHGGLISGAQECSRACERVVLDGSRSMERVPLARGHVNVTLR